MFHRTVGAAAQNGDISILPDRRSEWQTAGALAACIMRPVPAAAARNMLGKSWLPRSAWEKRLLSEIVRFSKIVRKTSYGRVGSPTTFLRMSKSVIGSAPLRPINLWPMCLRMMARAEIGRITRIPPHPEHHLVERVGWLRAAVLGANDGILSTASLIVGVAAAATTKNGVLVAGVAGLVAGAMSMATGEYVSVSSQSDTE